MILVAAPATDKDRYDRDVFKAYGHQILHLIFTV